jgi:hypothetical protein
MRGFLDDNPLFIRANHICWLAGRLLCMFRDVYFITCRLGQFTAYQEVLLVIATSLREQPQVFAETVQYISLPPGPLGRYFINNLLGTRLIL